MASMYSGAYPQSLLECKFPRTKFFSNPNFIFATPLVTFLETNSKPRRGEIIIENQIMSTAEPRRGGIDPPRASTLKPEGVECNSPGCQPWVVISRYEIRVL